MNVTPLDLEIFITFPDGTIESIAAVPELSTWAMMIVGLLVLTFMALRRKQMAGRFTRPALGIGIRFAVVAISFIAPPANAELLEYTGVASGFTNWNFGSICGAGTNGCSFTNIPYALTYSFNMLGDPATIATLYLIPGGTWTIPNGYSTPVSVTGLDITQDIGYHGYGLDIVTPSGFNIGLGTEGGADGTLDAQSVVVTGVPEPSTLAMMLIGFAAIGAAGWRRLNLPNATEPLSYRIRL
jgi:hypothetical protein